MCCLFTSIVLVGPRAGILVWGLLQPVRWEQAFDTFVWPLLGFIIAPWTTLMYVGVYPGGLTGLDWFWLVLAILFDIFTWTGGAYGNRDRLRTYGTYTPPPAAA